MSEREGDLPVLTFSARHHEAIISGRKRVTVRWNEAVGAGLARFVFDPPQHPALVGEILDVASHPTPGVRPDGVHEPASTDMVEYLDQLRTNHYPDMPDETVIQVVTFRLVGED